MYMYSYISLYFPKYFSELDEFSDAVIAELSSMMEAESSVPLWLLKVFRTNYSMYVCGRVNSDNISNIQSFCVGAVSGRLPSETWTISCRY